MQADLMNLGGWNGGAVVVGFIVVVFGIMKGWGGNGVHNVFCHPLATEAYNVVLGVMVGAARSLSSIGFLLSFFVLSGP